MFRPDIYSPTLEKDLTKHRVIIHSVLNTGVAAVERAT